MSGVDELRRAVRASRRRGTVAFVPTMGAIHDGHLSLVRQAKRSSRFVVASIFVNPLQFGPTEDYRRYPRPVRRDRALFAAAGVDLLWEPRVEDVYPPGDRTRVHVSELTEVLEGASRPGHFEGVTTVVMRLLGAVQPDVLWLGQKDAQQAIVLERMCADLLLPVRVRRGATVRENDGLAMSSRNAYLGAAERQQAVALSQGLASARVLLGAGERSAAKLAAAIRREWEGYPLVREDYVAVVDAATLRPVRRVEGRVLIAVAARVGPARLIDNIEWGPK
ncbi:MAG: pantoate--beta-alanine ligase [Candidatus Eisenbacteria bacterium]|uniref:Pantothenate synthetase n=1 Tax=Eiseniibacteriota bacterium TaxID=2212470 RepID=A0A933W811_UNCEI|nr:pantoate--beta-alanine ligase [Candidatus Eisenbacteria bacterium]